MFAIDSAGVRAGRGSNSLATAQSLVPNQRNMAAPHWDNGGFTFVKVHRPSFFTVYGLNTVVWLQCENNQPIMLKIHQLIFL